MGGEFEVSLSAPAAVVHPGLAVLISSDMVTGLVIAERTVTTGKGTRFVVEARAAYTLDSVKPGCPIRITCL